MQRNAVTYLGFPPKYFRGRKKGKAEKKMWKKILITAEYG